MGGSTNDQVANFEVKILILKSSYQDLLDPQKTFLSPFRPGMSATVDIKTLSKNNILIVPIQAVTTREDTASKEDKTDEVIFKFNDGMAQPIKVKTGIQDNKFIEVINGLEEKIEIISGPYSVVSKELKAGKKVIKKKKD
jgi:HlyD family secretion protein